MGGFLCDFGIPLDVVFDSRSGNLDPLILLALLRENHVFLVAGGLFFDGFGKPFSNPDRRLIF